MNVIAAPVRFVSRDGPDRQTSQHDEDVIQMNEARRCASGWVQRRPPKVVRMIDKPGHSDRSTS
jgi:hypothetical protein